MGNCSRLFHYSLPCLNGNYNRRKKYPLQPPLGEVKNQIEKDGNSD